MHLRMGLPAFRREFWVKSDQGSAAIEFAFVAPIFFALMLGVIEIGVMTFAQFALQNAVTDAGRLIRTGQAQNTNTAAAPKCVGGTDPGNYGSGATGQQNWFQGQICCGVSPLIPDDLCTANLVVTVASTSSGFSSSGFGGIGTPGTYSPGTACDVVLVRASYIWTIWFPGLKQLLAPASPADYLVDSPNNGHMLTGTAAFRNEPFNAGVAGC
jgi:Flp pilus assembly protein TadG